MAPYPYDNNSTSTVPDRSAYNNLTANMNFVPHYPETFTLTRDYYEEAKTKDEAEKEKLAAAKAEIERKRVKKMRDLWKLDRKYNNNKMR